MDERASLPLPREHRLSDGRRLAYRGQIPDGPHAWSAPDGLLVLASVDATQHGPLLHVSVSYRSRDPSWADLRAVRDLFYPPDVDVMQLLPQVRDYMNLQQHCFHLWQTPAEWGIQ